MNHIDENNWPYYASLSEIKEEGFTPVLVTNPVQFFQLKGKTSSLKRDNLEPIRDLKYIVLARGEEKYYMRESLQHSLDVLYFYRRSDTFSGHDDAIESLRRYIQDRRVWILFTPEMVEDTTAMLKRVYKTKCSGEGTIRYASFIEILDRELQLEDYREWQRSVPGYKTSCKMQEDFINRLWKRTWNNNKT